MSVINVTNLTKEYKTVIKNKEKGFKKIKKFFKPETVNKIAIKNLNLNVKEGEIIGFIGANGAGKSTSIKLLTGLLVPTSGEIRIFNMDPFLNRKNLAKKTGILMGNRSHLWWDLPLMDSFNMLKIIYEIPNEDYVKWSKYLFEIMEVELFLDKPVRQLSLGQRMRGEIIATFLHKPELVYLDEPTIGLDIESKKNINDFILKINKDYNTTIILTTHDISDVQKVCERMVLIDNSLCIYDGSVNEFIRSYEKFKTFVINTSNKNFDTSILKEMELVENNIYSKEYLYDTNIYSESDIFKEISHITGVTSVDFKNLDLPTVLKIYYKENKNGNK